MRNMKTRITELLGIKYPIIQGGMVYISTPELAAAVSNAGGLGQLTCTAGNKDTQSLRESIARTRELTDKPFAVNVPLIMPDADKFVETAVSERVDVITTSAGNPAKFTDYIKKHGIKVCHVVPAVKLGIKAEQSGVDFIVAEGYEAGGHNAYDDVTTMTLIPQITGAVKIPVVAAGGIADARGFVAAFVLGAEGIQMGTRFIMTTECIAHDMFKEAIAQAQDTDTVITGRMFGPTRVLKNKLSADILSWESQGMPAEKILQLIGPGRTDKALLRGEIEESSAMSGQIAGLIKDVVSVSDVIEGIMRQATEVLEQTRIRLNHF
jgi:enoyl-[acyl-carrier protein] reductase II